MRVEPLPVVFWYPSYKRTGTDTVVKTISCLCQTQNLGYPAPSQHCSNCAVKVMCASVSCGYFVTHIACVTVTHNSVCCDYFSNTQRNVTVTCISVGCGYFSNTQCNVTVTCISVGCCYFSNTMKCDSNLYLSMLWLLQ